MRVTSTLCNCCARFLSTYWERSSTPYAGGVGRDHVQEVTLVEGGEEREACVCRIYSVYYCRTSHEIASILCATLCMYGHLHDTQHEAM